MPDSILIINRVSGCYFLGKKLIHTDSCSCDDDYQSWKENND